MVDENGVPDFTVIDNEKFVDCVAFSKCGLCGDGLGRHKFFIGGPKSALCGRYVDAAMHGECARYALQACPFLAMGKAYSRKPVPEGCRENPMVSTEAPDKFGLLHCTGYELEQHGPGNYCLKATGILGIEWFTPHGTTA